MTTRPRALATPRSLALGAGGCVLLLEAGCRPQSTIEVPEPRASERVCPTPTIPTPAPGSADDREAPRITGVRFNGSDRVVLSFSEGLEDPKQVNPRQFRVSEAYSTIDYAGGYASGTYYDIATRYGDEIPIVFAAIEQIEPDELALILNRPIPPTICENIRVAQDDIAAAAASPDAAGFKSQHALFLHYTKRGSPGIRDLAGNTLDDFGAAWALHFGTRDLRLSGKPPVVRFDLLVELPCPTPTEFIGPPGPS